MSVPRRTPNSHAPAGPVPDFLRHRYETSTHRVICLRSVPKTSGIGAVEALTPSTAGRAGLAQRALPRRAGRPLGPHRPRHLPTRRRVDRRRGIDDDELLRSARAVAQYRGATLEPVAPHLAGYGAVAQAKWATEHGRCQHCWRHWKPAHVGRRNMDLLDAKQVSEMIGVPVGTLRHWRHSDIGPASFTLGRRVVYRRDEVSRWISKRESATRR